jgi:hypothetical protein
MNIYEAIKTRDELIFAGDLEAAEILQSFIDVIFAQLTGLTA